MRTNGRIAAFERSVAYLQYLGDIEFVRSHNEEEGFLRVEKGGAKGVDEGKKGKKRETGRWSRQWYELGVRDRGLSGEE